MRKLFLITILIVGTFSALHFAYASNYDYPEASSSEKLYDNSHIDGENGQSTPITSSTSPRVFPITFGTSGYPYQMNYWPECSVQGNEGYFELDDPIGVKIATTTSAENQYCGGIGGLSDVVFFPSSTPFHVDKSVTYTMKFIVTSGTIPFDYCATFSTFCTDYGGILAEVYTSGFGSSSIPASGRYINFAFPSATTTRDFPAWTFNYQNPISGEGYGTTITVSYSNGTSTYTDSGFSFPTGYNRLVSFEKSQTLSDGHWTATAGLFSVFTSSSTQTTDLIASTTISFDVSGSYINPRDLPVTCPNDLWSNLSGEAEICWIEKGFVEMMQWFFIPSDSAQTYWHSSLTDLQGAFPFNMVYSILGIVSSSTSSFNVNTSTISIAFSTSTFGPNAPNIELWNINSITQATDNGAKYGSPHPNFNLLMQIEDFILWSGVVIIIWRTIF